MKQPRSHLALGALACAAFYFAYSLGSSGRGVIDWTVLGLLGLAVLWNLGRLGQRLYGHGGGKDLWHLLRTLLFWILGLFNTALIRPEDVGSWKYFLGWALLALAALDTVLLYRKERAVMSPALGDGTA